jgi:hypothetical protein
MGTGVAGYFCDESIPWILLHSGCVSCNFAEISNFRRVRWTYQKVSDVFYGHGTKAG